MRIANFVGIVAGPILQTAIESQRVRKTACDRNDPAGLPSASNCIEPTIGGPEEVTSLPERQFIRVVPHKIQGTDVRVIAAIETNIAVVRNPGTLWI